MQSADLRPALGHVFGAFLARTSPEDRCLELRRDFFQRYGGWNVDLLKTKIIWWTSLQGVPAAVSRFLVRVMRHFKNNAKAAFQLIDGRLGGRLRSSTDLET